MKKIILVLLMFGLLVGCSKGFKDTYKAYRSNTAQELFNQGESQLKKGNYTNAVRSFEALDALYPFGPYAEQAELDSIYAYYKKGDDELSMAAADRYIRLYPRGRYVDYAYYMKGYVGFRHGFTYLQRKFNSDPAARDLTDKKQAFLAFNQVITYFPQSPYAPSAREQMIRIRNIIAHKYVMIADYYFQRKAYVAAANRASFVVAHFNGSPEVIPALTIMVKAYRRLELPDMANTTLKTLQLNYPTAPQLKELGPNTNV